MNIFYAVQVSNTTVVDGKYKWLIKNDACVNIMKGIVSTILDKDPNLRFIIKLPTLSDVYDTQNYFSLFNLKYHSNIKFCTHIIPVSPIISRFSFNFDWFVDNWYNILQEIDCMINDENTLTKNWRVLFDYLKLDIPIISTNYFLDSPIAKKVPEKIRYYERQIESFINSDINAFQCKASMNEAIEAMKLCYKNDIVNKVIKKSSVWGVGVYAKEILDYNTDKRFDIPTIYFGNRITDTANRYTNWDDFAGAIGIVSKYYSPLNFRAVILNPTKKLSDEQRKEILKLSNNKIEFIENDHQFPREEYLEFINKAHISCNLFTTEVHGGVTHAEALLANNIVIMPAINNYLTKFGSLDYPFLCKYNKKTMKINRNDLADKIISALTLPDERRKFYAKIAKKVGYKNESFECAAPRIIKDIYKATKK
jgi:hypothetical protein